MTVMIVLVGGYYRQGKPLYQATLVADSGTIVATTKTFPTDQEARASALRIAKRCGWIITE